MRVHVLQHVPFEGLAGIQRWLEAQGARVTATRFYENPALPALDQVDFVVALGGPMSVNDEAELPWLVDEKQFVRDAVAADKAVLGVCLGAQLISSALGGVVAPGPFKEVGWFPIRAVQSQGTFEFPEELEVFHWHGETFSLPDGAQLLAESPGCKHQAFQLGRRVVGLQFHLEMTEASIERIVDNCRNDLTPGRYVARESELLGGHPLHGPRAERTLWALLDYLTQGLATGG